MFVGVIFLLVLCFFESIIMNFDLGWKRLDYALKAATFGSNAIKDAIFPKVALQVVPHLMGFLFIYEFVHVLRGIHMVDTQLLAMNTKSISVGKGLDLMSYNQ